MPPDRGSNGRVSYSGQDDSVTFPHAAAVQGNGHYRPAGRQALRLPETGDAGAHHVRPCRSGLRTFRMIRALPLILGCPRGVTVVQAR